MFSKNAKNRKKRKKETKKELYIRIHKLFKKDKTLFKLKDII